MNRTEQVEILEKSIKRLETLAADGVTEMYLRLSAENQLVDALQVLRSISDAS